MIRQNTFIQCSNYILRDTTHKKISRTAKDVYFYLEGWSRTSENIYPSVAQIAYEIGVGESSVKAATKVLCECGKLKKYRLFDKSNIYKVLPWFTQEELDALDAAEIEREKGFAEYKTLKHAMEINGEVGEEQDLDVQGLESRRSTAKVETFKGQSLDTIIVSNKINNKINNNNNNNSDKVDNEKVNNDNDISFNSSFPSSENTSLGLHVQTWGRACESTSNQTWRAPSKRLPVKEEPEEYIHGL